MKSLAFLLTAIILCISAAPAAAAVITNQSIPIDITVFIPCANGGSGESVELTGPLHDMFSVTRNRNTLHVNVQDNPQGISGTGSVTGLTYHGTGLTRTDFTLNNANSFPFAATFINRFDMVGQKSSNNLEVHETAHITINANGTATANFDDFSVTCK